MGFYDIPTNVTPINEAYFGETPEIKNFQKSITNFRSKFIRSQYNYDHWNYTACPEIREICKSIEDCFGFGIASLRIDPTIIPNAYTIPLGFKMDVWDDMRSKVKINIKNGIKYDKKDGYAVNLNITGGLLFGKEFTDREVVAILLHEIGHNFSSSINRDIGALKNINKVLFAVSLIYSAVIGVLTANSTMIGNSVMTMTMLSNNIEKWTVELFNKLKSAYPAVFKSLGVVQGVMSAFYDIILELSVANQYMSIPSIMMALPIIIAHSLIKKIISLAMSPTQLIMLINGYQDEKFSDIFPTMYGYGPDIISALDKMSTSIGTNTLTESAIKKYFPMLDIVMDAILLPIHIILSPFDPHPNIAARTYNVITNLEKELEKNKDPRIKPMLQKDINNIQSNAMSLEKKQKMIREANLQVGSGDALTNKYFSKLYYGMCYSWGGDIRHNFFKGMKDNMDEIDSLMK